MTYVTQRLSDLDARTYAINRQTASRRDYYTERQSKAQARMDRVRDKLAQLPPSAGAYVVVIPWTERYWNGRIGWRDMANTVQLVSRAHRFESRALAYHYAAEVKGLAGAIVTEAPPDVSIANLRRM